jgi:stage III sporulation protein AD
MINILLVCGLVLCVAMLNKLLESHAKEYVLLITICAIVIVVLYVSNYLSSTLDFLKVLLSTLNDNDIYTILLKTLGICIVTNISVDVCKDANQNALSGVVLLTGKIAILSLSIPLLQELYYLVKKLMLY